MKTTVPSNDELMVGHGTLYEAYKACSKSANKPPQNNFNCPNCGAAVTGDKCIYCGTIFHDFTSLTVNESTYLIIKVNDRTYIVKAILQDLTSEFALGSIPELLMRFAILPMENG